MSNRDRLKLISEETVEIAKKGQYKNNKDQVVSIKNDVEEMKKNTVLYSPNETDDLLKHVRAPKVFKTSVSVTNETTLEAAKKLKEQGHEKVLCLNFASAKHPGGGFLNGSMAQEESLARASALYESLIQKMEMYEKNRASSSALYSDYMIYSPNVPVFRNDKHTLLDAPYNVSFLTSPAVNAGVALGKVKKGTDEEKKMKNDISDTMKKRIEKILAVALDQGYDTLVLGAFGCGVFKNIPRDVAAYFQETLTKNPIFKGAFKKIVFAVYDKTPGTSVYYAFKNIIR